jgi:DNA gyrase inhibitor GyrI
MKIPSGLYAVTHYAGSYKKPPLLFHELYAHLIPDSGLEPSDQFSFKIDDYDFDLYIPVRSL